MPAKRERPITHVVDIDRAMSTLDFVEMVALSEMFERWALAEEEVDPEGRTKFMEWSADYERIAAYCGFTWRAPISESPPDLIVFMAQEEVRFQRRHPI